MRGPVTQSPLTPNTHPDLTTAHAARGTARIARPGPARVDIPVWPLLMFKVIHI